MDLGQPQVTIVIPCTRSYEQWLPMAVLSAARQTAPVSVLVVGYDLSRDFGDGHANVKQLDVISSTKPFVLAEAYNHGIAEARTPYVLCLDADNILDPTFVARCLTMMGREPLTAPGMVVTPGFQHIGDAGSWWVPPAHLGVASREDWLDRNLAITSALFLKDLWLMVGGFRNVLYLDWDFWMRAFDKGAIFLPVQEALLYYRHHAANTTARVTDHGAERAKFRELHTCVFS